MYKIHKLTVAFSIGYTLHSQDVVVMCDHGVVLTWVALTGDQLRLYTHTHTPGRKAVSVCVCVCVRACVSYSSSICDWKQTTQYE